MDGPYELTGFGLQGGRACKLAVERRPGPVVFRGSSGLAPLAEVDVIRTDRGVQVKHERAGLDVDGVEHFLSALGGLGLHRGVAVAVEGGELPLADGGALAFAELLSKLAVAPSPPALRVTKHAELSVGDASYTFEPGPSIELRVRVDFAGVGTEIATWDGRDVTFIREIAWARTFGFAKDAAHLHATGRALGVDPRSVMVLDERGQVMPPGLPRRPDELARHKLLDLVGDLYLGGGPPMGRISAVRPGHGATRRALLSAIEEGIVAPALPDLPLIP